MADISKMVDRFLSWKLPKDFSPDCGIAFERTYNGYRDGKFGACERTYGDTWWPVGTNLFTADQARQMIEHMLGEAEQSTPLGGWGNNPSVLPDSSAAHDHEFATHISGQLGIPVKCKTCGQVVAAVSAAGPDVPTPSEPLRHTRSCASWHDSVTGHEMNKEECTCGLQWRIQTQTAETLLAAWQKRCAETERELAEANARAEQELNNAVADQAAAEQWHEKYEAERKAREEAERQLVGIRELGAAGWGDAQKQFERAEAEKQRAESAEARITQLEHDLRNKSSALATAMAELKKVSP